MLFTTSWHKYNQLGTLILMRIPRLLLIGDGIHIHLIVQNFSKDIQTSILNTLTENFSFFITLQSIKSHQLIELLLYVYLFNAHDVNQRRGIFAIRERNQFG